MIVQSYVELTENVEELKPLTTARLTEDHTSSGESWHFVQECLTRCSESHTQCRTGTKGPWYPTRLLDLRSSDATSKQCRLITTSAEQPTGDYVTLSHRWGQANISQLTKSTVSAMEDDIDVSQLPTSFQDAISVTRERLGISYLWIDSLCIFQDRDDLTDWTREAALMHQIYGNAYCNLSATGAEDSTQGFFFPKRGDQLCHVEIEFAPILFDPQAKLIKYAAFEFYYWEKHLARAPLYRRGWVVQERLLTPRVIHFGATQLFWECAGLTACEAYPHGLPPALPKNSKMHLKHLSPGAKGKRLSALVPKDSDPRFFAPHLWPRILEIYTQCQLTKPADKIIALSSIAKRMRGILHDEYVVGMWRRYLESELLWQVNHHRQSNGDPSYRPATYRAPSFSWASIEGAINPGTPTDQGLLFSVEGLFLDFYTNDNTGLIKNGHIILKGMLKSLELRPHPLADTYWSSEVDGIDIVEDSDEPYERMGPLVSLDIDQPDFDAENAANRLYCMPARGPAATVSKHLVCLIFEHLGKGEFMRRGCLTAIKQCEIDLILNSSSDGQDMPCIQYDSNTGQHLIRVI